MMRKILFLPRGSISVADLKRLNALGTIVAIEYVAGRGDFQMFDPTPWSYPEVEVQQPKPSKG